jgi:superoxide dismutase, Cu-Zn family
VRRYILCLLAVPLTTACARHGAAPAATPPAISAAGDFISFDGRKVGEAHLTQTPRGVRIIAEFASIAPGTHGLHIHAVGQCEPAAFTTAGAHFNPATRKHGFKNPAGHHAGDLPNVLVGMAGAARVDTTTTDVTLGAGAGSLLDVDGSSLVLHDSPDDYMTDPSGNSGRRIACAVIRVVP